MAGLPQLFKMSSQLQLFPKKTRQRPGPVLSSYKESFLAYSVFTWLGWDLKDLKLSLCCNSDPMELGLFAYWCVSSGAVFTCQPGLYFSMSTVFPEPLLGLTAVTSLWILLQDPASGHYGTRGNAFHTLHILPTPITSLHTWLKSSVNLGKEVENVCRSR